MDIEKYAKDLLNIVTDCLNEIVVNDDLKKLMNYIMEKLVKITNNKYGFLGEIIKDRTGKKFVKYQSIINLSNKNNDIPSTLTTSINSSISNVSGSYLSEEYDYPEIFNLIYSEKKIIISNDIENDHRNTSNDSNNIITQSQDVILKKIIGIPLIYKSEIISVLVLANYHDEYDNEYIQYIKPFIPLISNIIINYKNKISLNYQKDLFLSHMSHEIRTPLNGIIGMGQFLMDTKLNDEQKKMIHIINKCSLQLLSFVNDLLDFSHITDGKINFEMKEFDLEECLKSALELFQLEIDDKRLSIFIEYDRKIPIKIIHDRQRIQQIIVNIVSNAIKFSDDKGSIKISIKLERYISDEQILLKLVIEDKGCGISSLELDKIKDKLKENDEQQTLNNYNMNYSIGLGLPICKFLINKMNGLFDIESLENKGTTITIKIPFKYNNIRKNICDDIKDNNQVLIISNNLEKRLSIVGSVINIGLLPIPVSTIEESNIYITNVNTKFNLIIILINSLDDIKNTLNSSNHGEQRYNIYKLIKNSQSKNHDTNLVLFYNKNNIPDKELSIFDFIEYKFDINLIDKNNIIDILGKQLFNPKNNKNDKNDKNNNNLTSLFNLDNIKILSVEDNYSNQKVIHKMLTEIGILSDNITCLCDGINFIENIENGNTYDIVFIDLKMPRLNGIEATKELQKKRLKKNMFFIAITATVTDNTIKECFSIGMDAFIPKPIDIKNLVNIIKAFMNKKIKNSLTS
jgi:two-component system sensor histidine kinase/response regulator